MKTRSATLVLLTALLVPSFAHAQRLAKDPDYSPQSLQKFVMSLPPEEVRERNWRIYMGGVEFDALNTRWQLFRPMLPFSGSRLTTNREIPDPFSLTSTAIATPMRAWHTQRQLSAELRRIEKSERARIRIQAR